MNLHVFIQLFIVASIVTAVPGCAADPSPVVLPGADGVATIQVSGAGQHLSISHPGPFDLDVSGNGHTLTIPAGNAIRTLRASGVHHDITIAAGATVQSIGLAGIETTIHLPKSTHPAVRGSGIGSRILNDVDKGDVPG